MTWTEAATPRVGAADVDAGEDETEEIIEVVDADAGKSIARGSRGD
jgi:hypothetical protein